MGCREGRVGIEVTEVTESSPLLYKTDARPLARLYLYSLDLRLCSLLLLYPGMQSRQQLRAGL